MDRNIDAFKAWLDERYEETGKTDIPASYRYEQALFILNEFHQEKAALDKARTSIQVVKAVCPETGNDCWRVERTDGKMLMHGIHSVNYRFDCHNYAMKERLRLVRLERKAILGYT